MADTLKRARRGDTLSRRSTTFTPTALVSAAQIVAPTRQLRLFNLAWQNEAWNFYRTQGTLKYGINWRAQAMSRVRLRAAIVKPGGEEPELLDDGPAVELMSQFFNGTPGQAQFMQHSSVQLEVPGECYVVVTDDDEIGERCWWVKSSSELQVTSGRVKRGPLGRSETVDLWQILVDAGVWKTLPPETLVFKIWNPDQQFSYMPDSPVNGVLRTLRIIDIMERRIMAQSISRLASNGIFFYPQEATFAPKPGYDPQSGMDPFTHEWLEVAGKTIENPGSALAAIPMPLKVPKDLIQYFVHQKFDSPYDERTMEILAYEYDRLATGLNLPKEMVTGMGDTSHWNAWALDESAVKIHISPGAEMLCEGVTRGYLHPALRNVGLTPDTPAGRLVAWYDPSELIQPPDLSTAADQAYDRDEISGDAYRELKGMDASMKPSKTELREQLLLKMAKDPTNGPAAIEELTGAPVAGASTGPGGESPDQGEEPTPATGPPDRPTQQPAEPPPPTSR